MAHIKHPVTLIDCLLCDVAPLTVLGCEFNWSTQHTHLIGGSERAKSMENKQYIDSCIDSKNKLILIVFNKSYPENNPSAPPRPCVNK